VSECVAAGVADLAHEMGHDVENTVGRPLKNLIDANEQSMRAFAGDAGANMDAAGIRREGFGEFMSGFITNREMLRQTDPDFTRAFVELMNNENPDLLAQLNRLTPPAGLSSRRSVGLVRAATRHPPVGRSDLLGACLGGPSLSCPSSRQVWCHPPRLPTKG
jgi:hypothetical protein